MSDLWSPSSLGPRLGSPVSQGVEESIPAWVASHPLMDRSACDLFTGPRPPGPVEEASPLRPVRPEDEDGAASRGRGWEGSRSPRDAHLS